MRQAERELRTFPFLPERVITTATRFPLGRRAVSLLEEKYYGSHIVQEDRIANSIEGIASIVASAQEGQLTQSLGLTRANIANALEVSSLIHQASGIPSPKPIHRTLPHGQGWVAHRVEVVKDKSGREIGRGVFTIRQHKGKHGGNFRDSVQFYSHDDTGQIILINREELLPTPQDPGRSRVIEATVRFTRQGKTFLDIDQSEVGLGGVVYSSDRFATVVDKTGQVLPTYATQLQDDPGFFMYGDLTQHQ